MLAVTLLFVGHLSCLRVNAANTLTSVNMMESSFVIVVESTLPASGGYTTMDINTYQIIPTAAALMSTEDMSTISKMEPITISDIFTGTRLLTMMFGVQKTTTIKQTIPMPPESVTFSGQTRVITTAGRQTLATNSLTVTVLPTFMTRRSLTPSVLLTTEESQASGGIVAAIVVTACTIVIVLAGITVTILIICLQKRRRGKKYILSALKDDETQGIFMNAGATTLESEAENETTNSKLNHSISITTSDFSGDHVYEMTEMTQTMEQPHKSTNASPPSTEQLSSISLRRQQVSSSLHGNHMRRQQRSFPHYENTRVLHRYNSVGDYEMMKPQLQKVTNKRYTQALPVETVDIYSEIERSVDNKDELYIEMKPEEIPSLPSEGENLNSNTHTASVPQITTKDDDKDENYIKMETEENKLPATSQTSDNTKSQSIVEVSEEASEKEQNGAYIKMEPEGVTDVCTPLATDKDKQVNSQTSNNQASSGIPNQQVLPAGQEDELSKIYIEMEQDTTNPSTPELDQPTLPVNQEVTEDNIYIEMEPDDMPGTSSPKHQSPHINSDTPDDQLLSQGSEDIYIMMH